MNPNELPVIDLDDSDENADWIKSRTWDIFVYGPDGPELVTTLPQLFLFLGVSDEHWEIQAGHLQQFLDSPAAKPMPLALREAITAWDAENEEALAREIEASQGEREGTGLGAEVLSAADEDGHQAQQLA